MFDSPSDFFALVIAIVAFIFARKAFNQVATLRARLDALETAAPTAATVAAPPPLPRYDTPIAPSAAPTGAETTKAAPSPMPPRPTPQAEIPVPPSLPQPAPGFEERIGTRWVVWVGGLTLAL